MSDEFEQPDQGEGAVFKPLKSTRTEHVEVGGIGSGGSDKTFEGLKATTVSTDRVSSEDATPLVVVDDEQEADGDRAKTPGELIGELRSLRSRNQILRTERTSIAGRKYALEVVIETLREKLDAVAELCDRLDAPGELGEALREIKLILGDARRIADSKAVLEADLEAERAQHLQERQSWEQKAFDLNQQLAGIRSERDALKGMVSRVERERMTLEQELEVERRSLGEAESQAVDQLEGYMAQIQELEAQVASSDERIAAAETRSAQVTAEREDAVNGLEEAVQQAEQATARADELEAELEAANARADASAARLSSVESKKAELERERSEVKGRLDKLEGKVGKQKATIGEQRKALVEMKPFLEDWTKLEKENDRLARLVGEARKRGRVNVQELMARAALLKKLERLTAEGVDDD